ncbi:unnamed protein product [Schistosoma rodhaini]|nr:unnamed protein product [Schistosoma rodhaini]
MYKNGYAIERILRCKLDKDDFDHLLFWSGSSCHLDNDKPEFKHFIIGQQWLYTMNHPQRQLDNIIHFNSILGIECIGDLAMFLTCQITRNYNHICIEFVSKLNQQHRKGVISVNKTEQKVNFTDKIETKEKQCPIKDDVNIDQQDEILSSKVTWYQSNNEFKYMVAKLIHLTDFQHPLTSNKQSISSLSSSPPPSGDNIETLIAKATRRNTIVYSTTAENEDLQQLMNMFKPFFKSDTIISMEAR